ncbi:MAG: ATP-grasp domain-containing protein [Hahellaceae bacterium]|nr:ATP-grasp domain-containing protein [Hahellaceae bacterium]
MNKGLSSPTGQQGGPASTIGKSVELSASVRGLWSMETISAQAERIRRLTVDDYERDVIQPQRQPGRLSARKIMQALANEVLREVDRGPLQIMEVVCGSPETGSRTLGFIAQNREQASGVWGPEHHHEAALAAADFARRAIPVVTFMDTPGADAGEKANLRNQAHSISRLIAVMAQLPVPTLGIIVGTAYSGGAIPLAATNLLLSVKDGVFSTIQPQGLASIARKQKLAWQQCAQIVGVAACETVRQGWLDGIIDYSPNAHREGFPAIQQAVISGIGYIEECARRHVLGNDVLLQDYQVAVTQYLQRRDVLQGIENSFYRGAPAEFANIFDLAFRQLRFEKLRGRLRFTTVARLPNASAEVTAPATQSADEQKPSVFQDWLQKQEKLIYEERLTNRFRKFIKAAQEKNTERNTLISFVLGRPDENFKEACSSLCFELGLYLFNRWKAQASEGFAALRDYLNSGLPLNKVENLPSVEQVTLNDLLTVDVLHSGLRNIARQMQLFDALYDGVLNELVIVAKEADRYHRLSQDSVALLLEAALSHTRAQGNRNTAESVEFAAWLKELMEFYDLDWFLRQVAEWKQHQHARLSETLFVFITYLFEKIFPSYLAAANGDSEFDGKISPTWIGRRKDFWHRLSVAYCDLQIQALQREYKTQWPDWKGWVDELCESFTPLHPDWVSADPCHFPGFLPSIHQHVQRGGVPAGIVAGEAVFKGGAQRAGLMISNLHFQAGALDMASAAKMLAIIEHCRVEGIPIVGIISSGGMQTKEGAGSLFAMAAVNEAITRFRQETGLPVIMVGFGDCTGGAQASFVTHPLAETWYISGANIPFAGQIVVPTYLPSICTLANYLGKKSGTMKGLLSHPFADSFDRRLMEIDVELKQPDCTIQDMLSSQLQVSAPFSEIRLKSKKVEKVFRPLGKLLIHARGCTAVKLIEGAQKVHLPIVLVQSDPDMDSVAAEMLGTKDELICIGGNTPDESYLNANSVLEVASMTGADSLHPGIGFLSEDPDFAKRCQLRKLNFIGPDYHAMARMGDKSRALKTAIKAGVPVVPGSHGVLADLQDARQLAGRIGFPVLLKAAFGGGGKGIAKLERMEDLAETYTRLTREAEAAFGRGQLYMERFVSRMRHIEVQVLRDRFGNCRMPGLRDCSVQRNNQKLLEESGSTLLTADLANEAFSFAERIAHEVDYVGAGTVEFIYDLDHSCLYFMEMNTRLQVEHPVTELVSGLDIVAAQLSIAAGESIQDMSWKSEGYAIEARINAEQVVLDGHHFHCHPAPGLVTGLEFPVDSLVKVIRCVGEGKRVAPYYDSLIMQVVARGRDRDDAIQRLAGFLKQTRVQGIHTNIPFLVAILEDSTFRLGDYDTGFLRGFSERVQPTQLVPADDAVEAAPIDISIPGTDEIKVLSPVTSIFYRSLSPQDKPYVEEGDVVDVNQTLCLMEAMKVFSPLKLSQLNEGGRQLYAEAGRYQVTRVMNDDGQQVNAGDLLFVIKPLATEAG